MSRFFFITAVIGFINCFYSSLLYSTESIISEESFLRDSTKNLYCNIIKAENDISHANHSFSLFVESIFSTTTNDYLNHNSYDDSNIDSDLLKGEVDLYTNILNKMWISAIYSDFEKFLSSIYSLKSDFYSLVNNNELQLNESYISCYDNYNKNIDIAYNDAMFKSDRFNSFIFRTENLAILLMKYFNNIDFLISSLSNNIINSQDDYNYLQGFLKGSDNDFRYLTLIHHYITNINMYWLSNIRINLVKISTLIYNIRNIINNLGYYARDLKINPSKLFEQLSAYNDNYMLVDSSQLYAKYTDNTLANDRIYDNGLKKYQQSFNLLQQSKLLEARESFLLFIKQYEKSTFIANAYYWLGEIEYELKRFNQAYEYYIKCYEISNIDDMKHILSMVKISLSLLEMDQRNKIKACNFLFNAKKLIDSNKTNNYIEILLSGKIIELNCNKN